jgi:serine protease Do
MASTAIADLQATIEDVAANVGPAVVGLGRGWHPGSGVVTAEGTVLTNAHNLRGEELAVTFADGRTSPARAAGVDPGQDLALLSVDTGDVEPVSWVEGESARVGSAVVALANPGGRGLRATLGFVSAPERSFRGPRGRRITGCIEHTAPLPRGSSGGPLVDPSGRLLGLNAIRLEGGLILAVPVQGAARQRIEALARGESTEPPRLGVAVAPPYVARRMRRAVGLPEREGVLVRAVEDSGAAARAGIERGDLIVAAAGAPVDRLDTLYEALDSASDRSAIELTVLRGAQEREVTVSFDKTGSGSPR